MASAVHDRLGYLLKHAYLALGERTTQALSPLGVNGRELAVLTVLDLPEPLAQQEAGARLGVDRTTMVDLVDTLEERGFVARQPDPADRRRRLVRLTDEGRRVLTEGDRVYQRVERDFLGTEAGERLKVLLRQALR